MELWSTLFLEDVCEADWATCTTDLATWQRILRENEGAKRIFARIELSCGRSVYVALGAPCAAAPRGQNRLYAPPWMLEGWGANGTGEVVTVDWFWEEAFPEATRIVLRPHDSAFYHADAKEELEVALTRLGVIAQGDMVQIPLARLGGYEVNFDVVTLEPANLVLAQGEEVAIEFEEALDAAAALASPVAAARSPTPIPTEEEVLDGPMLPPAVAAPATGHVLGHGATGPRFMPDGRRWNPYRDGPWKG